MKKLIFSLLLSILAAGCEVMPFGVIVDWAPVDIYIEAVDADGKSIISPEMPGMTLTFKGETYTVQDPQNPAAAPTRAYAPIMYGLVARPVNQDDQNGDYRLCFGEIDGAADMDEDILLHWPDGSEDVIHYHCSDHREWPDVKCKRSWKLNGEKHEGNTFSFTGKGSAK